MVPTTALALLSFFALVAPGLFFDLLLSKKQADRSETAFREAGRVVLVSAWCSVVSAPIVLGVVKALRTWVPSGRDWVPSARDLVIGERTYLADHIAGLSLMGVVFIVASLGVSKLTFWVIYRDDPGQVSQVSVWRKVFRDDAPSGAYPFVRIKMQSGASWTGHVAHYSPDLEIADREIVLSSPVAMKDSSGKSSALPKEWSRVVLRADQIESIAVQYQALADKG